MNTLFYKKNKREGFRLTLFMFLGLLAIVAILPFSLASEDTQAEEKKLSTIFPNIYATLMDQNGKIVSTTDPNKTVDSRYSSTASTRYLTLDDNLYLHLDTEEVENENLEEQIVEGQYYYIDLPEHFIPNSATIITSQDDELELFNMGKVNGYGGIYFENNIYRLKVRFSSLKDSYSIKFSYQFSLKLTDKVYEQDPEQKAVSIEDVGSLIFYVRNIVTPEVHTYTIAQTSTKKGVTNDIYTLTTTLTDTRENGENAFNGKLTIDLDTDFGFNSYAQNEYLKGITIYADGQELTKGDSTSKQITFTNDKVKVAVNATGVVDIGTECTDDANACLLNKFELTITGNTTPNAEVSEIKVVFDEKITTPKSRTHMNYASYADNIANESANTSRLISDSSRYIYPSSVYNNKQLDIDDYTPTIITQTISFPAMYSNYLELTLNQSKYSNYDDFKYFLDSTCFYNEADESNCGDKLKISIDGNLVSFTNHGLLFNNLYNRNTVKPDPAVYMQMKEQLGSNLTNLNNVTTNPTYLWQSDELNSDGEYYYVVISYDTYNRAYNNNVANGGRNEYSYEPDSNGIISSTPQVKLFLFNISGHSLKFDFDYKLGVSSRSDDVNYKEFYNYWYNYYSYDGYGSNYRTTYSYPYFDSLRYMATSGEMLNTDFVKWETVVNTKEINKYNNQSAIFYIDPYEENIDLTNESLYSVSKKMIVNQSSTTGQTLGTDYLKTNELYIGRYNSTTHKCEGNYTPLTLTKVPSGGYKGYLSGDVYSASISELDTHIVDDRICFVYFNRDDYTTKIRAELDVIGTGSSTTGYQSRNVIYESNGVASVLYNSKKSLLETKIDETKTTNVWSYVLDNIGSYSSSCYRYNQELPYSCSYYDPKYNGNVHFYDNMEGELAKYTTLNKIKVNLYNDDDESLEGSVELLESDLDELDNTKCVDGICVHVSYPSILCNANRNDTTCLSMFYGTDYLSKLTKMDNGFTVSVTGISNTTRVEVTYETVTDDMEAITGITTFNEEIKTYNYIYKNAWHYMEPFEESDYKNEGPTEYFVRKYVAGVAVSKSNETTEKVKETKPDATDEELSDGLKTYLTADTNFFKVNVLVGQSGIDHLDLNDKLIGFLDVESPTDADLSTFLQYMSVSGLKISYIPVGKTIADATVIYEGEEFKDGWTSSTISFDKTNKNLYSLHLVNSDGNIPAQSSFEIEYNLIFDIDNTATADELSSYRLNELYTGGAAPIDTDVEVIIPYDTSFEAIEDIITSNDKNYIAEGLVHCFLDNSVQGTYLVASDVKKSAASVSTGDVESVSYQIVHNTKSAGKPVKPRFSYADILSFDLGSVPSDNQAAFTELLIKHLTISDLTIADETGRVAYQNENEIPFSSDTINFESSSLTGSFTLDKSGKIVLLSLRGELSGYDKDVTISYKVNLNKTAFIDEAVSMNLLDSNLRVTGTNSIFTMNEKNVVSRPDNLNEELASASSGRISFNSIAPSISKTVSYPSALEQTWTIRTSSNRKMSIADTLSFTGSEGIADFISIKDMVIKVDGVVIYENDAFKEEYANYASFQRNGMNLSFNFQDQIFSEESSNLEIKYTTVFDKDGYYEGTNNSSGNFVITNEVSASRDGLVSRAATNSRTINFNYPLINSKSFLGNGLDLATSLWRIQVQAKDLLKKNVVISDTVTVAEELKPYLAISNLVIKKVVGDTETVIYDHGNNVNELGTGITIKDKEGNDLQFDTYGLYEFVINVDELAKDNKLIIDYALHIDDERYRNEGKETDVRLNIANAALVSSGNESYNLQANGYSTVESLLTKQFNIVSTTSDQAIISWNINVNLNVDYEGRIDNNDIVKITDELFDSLRYVDGTLKIYGRVVENSVSVNKLLVLNEDYEFTYNDNVIEIRLLKPKDTSVVNIAFNTTCSSTEGLKNYVVLKVQDDTTRVGTETPPPIFLRFIGGTIISKQTASYNIEAKKYLNGELSDKTFKFNLKEVDILGQTIENGVNITAENDENGIITFGSIRYNEAGIHFYRISEVNENERNYEYDSKEYTIMVQVSEYNNYYLIEKSLILSDDENLDEIAFYNYGGETAIELSKTWDDSNDQDGKRKDVNGKVQLYKSVDGGEPVKVDGDDYLVDVPTSDGVIIKWEHLPVYENGKVITYSVKEEVDDSIGYRVSIGDSQLAEIDKVKTIAITNSYTREQTSVEVSKTWADENNKANKRDSLKAKVQLYKSVDGGEPVKVEGSNYLVNVPTKDGVVVKWDHLPVYENGKVITYSVKEEVDESIGYVVDNGNKFTAKNNTKGEISITNTYTVVEPEPQPEPQPEPEPTDNPDNPPSDGHDTEIEETETVVPKTGDRIIYSFIGLLASIGTLVLIIIYVKRRKAFNK